MSAATPSPPTGGLGAWASDHPGEAIIGVLMLIIGLGALMLRRSANAPGSTAAVGPNAVLPSGHLGTQGNPYVEYIPTSYSVTSELNSGNITGPYAAPGGSITGSVGPVSGNTFPVGAPVGAPVATTPPPVTAPPPVAAPPPQQPSGYRSALDLRNRVGDGALVGFFSQFRLPSWIALAFVADNWQAGWPPTAAQVSGWLQRIGLSNGTAFVQTANPNASDCYAVNCATVPAAIQARITAAYSGAGMGGGVPDPLYHGGADTHLAAYAAPTSSTYTVRPGDTIGTIAARVGSPWHHLYERNRQAIDSVAASHGYPLGGQPWNNLMPGTVLEIG